MLKLPERISQANALLRPFAVPHEGILGREHAEPTDETRFPFQRDRDRIIHSTAFRRLKGKTQVFVTGDGDHYRTRLTHTLEVAQIARDIARTLGLNEDLAECIALSHDLGHPPFGHAGEASLDEWMRTHGERFEHNEQSLRIVTLLERHSSQFPGLNLNREVLEGIRKHEDIGHSLEAQIVDLSDAIAYTSHDCDDGLREGLLTVASIEKTLLGRQALKRAQPRGTSLRGGLIELLVTDLYEESEKRLSQSNIKSADDVLKHHSPLIGFSSSMEKDFSEMKQLLWNEMYMHKSVETKTAEGKKIVHDLCMALEKHPTAKITELMKETGSTLIVAVKDYVAGMTDQFAKESLTGLHS